MTNAAPVSAGQSAPISAAERQQGNQEHPKIVAEFGGAYTGPQAAYATRVGRKIAVQSGLSADPAAFDVTLLNSSVNNAFAIPGGYVYVTRELVALMNDEAELAAVLGHEVAHVAARHSAKRQSAAQRNSILGVLGQVLVGAVAGDSPVGELLTKGIGTGAQLVTLGYSRSQETQADDLGIRYLVRAGYDPLALSTMLESLAAQNSLDQSTAGTAGSIPEWASTHPDPASRVQRAADQARATGASSGVRNRDTFLAAIDGMMYGDDPAQGVVVGREFLHPAMRIAFTAPQGFAIQNGASAVSISGPNAQAQFSSAKYSGDMDAYIATVLRSLSSNNSSIPQAPVQRTTVNGIPAAYSSVRATSGSSQVDVTVFAYATSTSQAYHFIMLTPAGQGMGVMSQMAQSFHRLSASQAAEIKPRYVRVVIVKRGDTLQSLSAKMVFPDHRLERFLVLNRLTASSQLTPGQKVKVITY
ncbi:M48 family metalloprotease [Rhizorhapis sp. SPR117]|nr:M48 family metalloprotease [Rhizorhapis sp. SPR117]